MTLDPKKYSTIFWGGFKGQGWPLTLDPKIGKIKGLRFKGHPWPLTLKNIPKYFGEALKGFFWSPLDATQTGPGLCRFLIFKDLSDYETDFDNFWSKISGYASSAREIFLMGWHCYNYFGILILEIQKNREFRYARNFQRCQRLLGGFQWFQKDSSLQVPKCQGN